MNKYELMFIIKTSVNEESASKTIDELKRVFTKEKCEFKDMGQRKLAYAINKELNGHYYLIVAEATAKEIEEFKHKASISDSVLRFLVIKLDKE